MKKGLKKLATLLIAAGLLLGVQTQASAIDFKASGIWDFNFEWNNTSFYKDSGNDTFHARQRLRSQIDVIASESLKGVLFLEIGNTNWGQASTGGSLGTDATNIEVRYSYVDWVVPETELKIRMGLQPMTLPNFVAGSPILDHDAAGITMSYQFTDNIGATFFWMRAENENTNGKEITGRNTKRSDVMDFIGLTIPITGDGWAATPWGVYANVGRNSFVNGDFDAMTGLLPQGKNETNAASVEDRNNPVWWAGIGGELTYFDPFRFAIDAMYGRADFGTDRLTGDDLIREGWMVLASADYKLGFVTPGLVGWYSSGDNSDLKDGSERLPTIKASWVGTSFGFDGGWGIADCDALSMTPAGTWGLLLRFEDISFMEDLTHAFRIGYYTGSNSDDVVKRGGDLFSTSFEYPVYLTKKDHALEINFDSVYKIYDNLSLAVELAYINLDYDDDVWEKAVDTGNIEKNLWKAGINVRYAF